MIPEVKKIETMIKIKTVLRLTCFGIFILVRLKPKYVRLAYKSFVTLTKLG